MTDPGEVNNDLLSRISRNVEANLESFQQRSAWETASMGTIHQEDPKTSTKIIDGGNDSTLRNKSPPANDIAPTTLNSLNMQHWPSPVSGVRQKSIFRSVGETSRDDLGHISEVPEVTSRSYFEDSSLLKTDNFQATSVLRLADALTQHMILHPLIALRRTCQVNRKCSPLLCVQPFSLIPFLFHQQREQGVAALYKGLSSELLVKGMALGTETAIANYLDWPTEVRSKRIVEDSAKVLALKSISVALTTPFLCSSLIETVQSVIVVKDRPSFVDCIKDGFMRLFHLRLTPTSRMMPIWLIIVPTVCYHVTHSALRHLSQKLVGMLRSRCASRCRPRRQVRYKTNIQQTTATDGSIWQQEDLTYNLKEASTNHEPSDGKISEMILSSFIADVALFPFETVLHSLYVQGTRTIIDNCDETTVVLPVLTNYDGFSDCYQSILRFEGTLGLFKGLGAVMLQYTLHYVIFRTVYYFMKEFHSNYHSNSHSSIRQNKRVNSRFGNNHASCFETNKRHSTPYSGTLETKPLRLDGTPKRFE